jgi:hypothetical protein
MKRIVAIGSLDTFPHLLIGCFGTLSRYTRHGDEAYLLITSDAQPEDKDSEKWRLESVQRAAKHIGISTILFIEGFNHEEVSQHNVNLLRSFIEPIDPSVAFIPFRNAINPGQSVLGSSAFLACRGIANILLYIDGNSKFKPTIFSNLSDSECAIKQKCIQEFNGNGVDSSYMDKFDEAEQLLHDEIGIDAKCYETFESHRVVLLSANDII